MRIRRAAWPLFLAAAFLFALVALLPMRLALDLFGFGERGLSARAASGTLWLGALQEAQVGPVPLGDVKARLSLLPLFLGRARLTLRGADDATGLEGAVTVTRHSFGFDDVSARLRVGAMLAPLAVTTIDLDDVSAGFASGRCTRAGGRVRGAASGTVAGVAIGPALSGQARCAGEALLLPLASQTGMERLDLRLFADGRYRADLLVRPAGEEARGQLLAAGFRPSARGYALQVNGAF